VTTAVRPAAVAGTFYPDDAGALRSTVEAMLDAAPTYEGPPAKALIAPHAGHVYSGPIAASAYEAARGRRGEIGRVVLLGPAHRYPVRGVALSTAVAFDSPLGPVAVDCDAMAAIRALPNVAAIDAAHALEHSLEVHLPFIQVALGEVLLVPVLVGLASAAEVAAVIDAVWADDATLVVASSDLSHYHDHATAAHLDRRTADHIVAGAVDALAPEDACGAGPIRGLLLAAGRRGLSCTLLDLRSSGDTAGPRDRVVGYGAFVLA
jgi:AmmeMemoRadiSam system protein B